MAIDFGTTNTTVYVKSDGRSKAVNFTPRLRKCSISEDASAVSNYRSFMPAKEVVQPFTTVVQVRSFRVEGGVKSATSGQENELLFQDYAFFDDGLTIIACPILIVLSFKPFIF